MFKFKDIWSAFKRSYLQMFWLHFTLFNVSAAGVYIAGVWYYQRSEKPLQCSARIMKMNNKQWRLVSASPLSGLSRWVSVVWEEPRDCKVLVPQIL